MTIRLGLPPLLVAVVLIAACHDGPTAPAFCDTVVHDSAAVVVGNDTIGWSQITITVSAPCDQHAKITHHDTT